ncbi:hypothetical protein ILUMI_07330 [Ignelater luminosus]|uniref:Uncharacterized protein n=1 Tax=Ignelater luminosus TaxID=2038154 RepID=A0A8K0GBQ1_IGNLU|nr:hypothetical protein ILUMI_07330 [Ignelater luminosus]
MSRGSVYFHQMEENKYGNEAGNDFSERTFSTQLNHGGDSVRVWARISMEACTELVFIDGELLTPQWYVEEILANHLVAFAPFIGDDFVLMPRKTQLLQIPYGAVIRASCHLFNKQQKKQGVATEMFTRALNLSSCEDVV